MSDHRSISEIMGELRAHPDYVWGAVFVWGDIDSVLEGMAGMSPDVPEDADENVLRDHHRSFARVLESRCLEFSGWDDSVGDAILDIAVDGGFTKEGED